MKYIFVYNADSGKLNAILDMAHKMLSPDTYQCALCALTHNALSEKSAWSEFKKNFAINLEFLHKDEFEQQHNASFTYPVILEDNNSLRVVLSAEDISQISSTEELISQLRAIAE